jgi:hypothetical protein
MLVQMISRIRSRSPGAWYIWGVDFTRVLRWSTRRNYWTLRRCHVVHTAKEKITGGVKTSLRQPDRCLDLVEVWWVLQTIMTLFGHCGLYQDLTAT